MKVPVIGFHEFLAQHGLKSVDLLKLDIEGAELELLSALTSPSNIAQITVEFHDFMFPETHPQVTRTIGSVSVSILKISIEGRKLIVNSP